MASKTSRTTNFSEQEKLLLAELGRDFPEVESRGYDRKTLTLGKTTKAREEILTKYNSQKHNVSKATSASFKDGTWRWLKLQSRKEHDFDRRESEK